MLRCPTPTASHSLRTPEDEGPVIFGPLSDRLGRRGPLLLGTLIYLL